MKAIIIVLLLGSINTSRGHYNKNRCLVSTVDTIKLIKDIKSEYAAFNSNINKYQILEKDLMGETTEGGFIAAYCDKKILRKVTATYYKETGKVITQYYFNQNALYFAFIQEYSYNKPMYEQGSKIAAIKEDRYYFNKGVMLRWLDNNEIKDPKSKEFAGEALFLLKDAETLRKSIVDCKQKNAALVSKKDTVRCKYGSDCPSTGYIIRGSRSACGDVTHVKPKNKKVPLEQ